MPQDGVACGKAVVDDDGLMRAMKGAQAQMHDAGRNARAVIGRAADGGRQPVEIGAAKTR